MISVKYCKPDAQCTSVSCTALLMYVVQKRGTTCVHHLPHITTLQLTPYVHSALVSAHNAWHCCAETLHNTAYLWYSNALLAQTFRLQRIAVTKNAVRGNFFAQQLGTMETYRTDGHVPRQQQTSSRPASSYSITLSTRRRASYNLVRNVNGMPANAFYWTGRCFTLRALVLSAPIYSSWNGRHLCRRVLGAILQRCRSI